MKISFLLIGCLTFLMLSCENGAEDLSDSLVDISEFKIDTSALKDGDYVQILGLSGNLTQEHKHNFYNLIPVVSERTGDTVNVLMTTFFHKTSSRRTRFMSNSTGMGKLMESAFDDKHLKGKNINTMKAKRFSKVLWDKEFIEIDVRRFPAVTGTLGEFTFDESSDLFNEQ